MDGVNGRCLDNGCSDFCFAWVCERLDSVRYAKVPGLGAFFSFIEHARGVIFQMCQRWHTFSPIIFLRHDWLSRFLPLSEGP